VCVLFHVSNRVTDFKVRLYEFCANASHLQRHTFSFLTISNDNMANTGTCQYSVEDYEACVAVVLLGNTK
jgi:hypothetical protein